MGKGEIYNTYSGVQTEDISGYYVSTRTGFEGVEKVLNFLLPNRMLSTTGSLSQGFSMNGENYYISPIGNIKLINESSTIQLLNIVFSHLLLCVYIV